MRKAFGINRRIGCTFKYIKENLLREGQTDEKFRVALVPAYSCTISTLELQPWYHSNL